MKEAKLLLYKQHETEEGKLKCTCKRRAECAKLNLYMQTDEMERA